MCIRRTREWTSGLALNSSTCCDRPGVTTISPETSDWSGIWVELMFPRLEGYQEPRAGALLEAGGECTLLSGCDALEDPLKVHTGVKMVIRHV
jgi:hypothetical protein